MSDKKLDNRLRLGPIATALIEGVSENRQEALDSAIQQLQETIADKENEMLFPSDADVTLGSLSAQIRQQTATMSALRLQVLKEMQMLRILVASLMSGTDTGQQELLAFATEAIGSLRKETGLIKEMEQAELTSREDAFNSTVRREMQQTSETIEKDQEEEIER